MDLVQRVTSVIRDVPDFPKPGILFKDITPLMLEPALCKEVVRYFASKTFGHKPDAIIGIESRGFFFGPMIAAEMNIPFIPVRKAGKLPYKTISFSYDLEYGSSKIEMHVDAVKPGMKVVVHDDLLATGGTAGAAAELVKMCGGEVHSFTFLVELDFLDGRRNLLKYSDKIEPLLHV